MSRRGGKLAPFVPIFRHTMKSAAWKATSVGARVTFLALKMNYNTNAQKAVFLSSRDGAKEMGVCKDTVCKWLHELEHYGFIVEVQGAHLGLTGTGKAAHYRLTDCHFAGQAPTYDFQNWDGTIYDPKNPVRKRRTHRPKRSDTSAANAARKRNKRPKESDIRTENECPKEVDITSLTTPRPNSETSGGAEVVPFRRLPWSTPKLIEVFGSERDEWLKILAQISTPIPRRLAQ